MKSDYSGFPRQNIENRADSEKWRIFELDDSSGFAVLTEAGMDLVHWVPGIRVAVGNYRKAVEANTTNEFREYLNSGGNSDVYCNRQAKLAFKEASTAQSTWSALNRIDYIYHICMLENSPVPQVQVPAHYGAVFHRSMNRQYLIMELANNGFTVEDYASGTHDPEILDMIRGDLFLAREYIQDSAKQYFPEIETLLTDWHEGNVIVDFSIPSSSVPYTLWVIDQ